MELLIAIVLIIAVALLIGYTVDRITVGGDGIWYGNDEPPEGFVGFWDKGLTVVQWPKPTRVECIVIDGLTAEDLTVTGALYGDIVVSEINAGSIQAHSVSVEDIISDPDFPGMITTKQELARRREMEK